MEKFLGLEYPEGTAREDFLDANADSVEEIGYQKRFTTDELLKKKDDLSTIAIEINDIEEEKKEAMHQFKERLDPLNKDKAKLLADLKNKSEFVNEKCYKVLDHERREAGYYNKQGELVYSRPMQAQEMQKTIYELNRKTV